MPTRAHLLVPVGCAALALPAFAVLASSGQSSGRATVLSQLERPAARAPAPSAARSLRTVKVGPRAVDTVVDAGRYRLAITLSPNRASRPSRVSVKVNLRSTGAAVAGARTTLTYGMPSMGMQNVLSSALQSAGAGVYSAHEPELAMPGPWSLRIQVTPPDAAAVAVTLSDRMPL